ncbi:DNA alkylation repair protein [Paraglaciecola aquimarina]|uniref:DNA alkylation repair protein n=1 Tax=Paraglaciecola aquimarina TaxID=1235557 RepID=A0ABU3SWI9_9ALTE|nr:DNA alkylation repair protein [Paraglaciecola aquimarina]MDU0354390.1 DNA alkylation repair protein [Paraglaciecola aquimarina]
MATSAYIVQQLKRQLSAASTPEKAQSARRYFPRGIHCLGANALDIKHVIRQFHLDNPMLNPEQVLAISEALLRQAKYSEEVMVGYGLINKFVSKYYDDDLLFRFEYWLEHYANNWALVDDLCMKTLYKFLLARPHLIEHTKKWAYSNVSWCRRGSNVAWVKFIKRPMGKSVYYLDKNLVFNNCDVLIVDADEFVQKSVGWLLKVTAVYYPEDVVNYLQLNHQNMQKSTIRYALEKVAQPQRKRLLKEFK